MKTHSVKLWGIFLLLFSVLSFRNEPKMAERGSDFASEIAHFYAQILPKNDVPNALVFIENWIKKQPNPTLNDVKNYLQTVEKTGKTIDYVFFYKTFVSPHVSLFTADFFDKKEKNNDFLTVQTRHKKAELGKLLFFDPIFSQNAKRSCASCHRPEKAFCDQRTTSRGFLFAENLTKNAPTLINAALTETHFFHEGQHTALPQVFEAVITNPKEFNFTFSDVVARLQTSEAYLAHFSSVFEKKQLTNGITRPLVEEAVVEYLKILRGYDSAFDKMMRGETHALNAEAQRGFDVFMNKARCGSCHAPPHFGGSRKPFVDSLTRFWVNTARVKVPALRNVAQTAPYGYDGRMRDLTAIFDDVFHKNYLPDDAINAQERAQIIAFLMSLNDAPALDLNEPAYLPAVPNFEKRAVGGVY